MASALFVFVLQPNKLNRDQIKIRKPSYKEPLSSI